MTIHPIRGLAILPVLLAFSLINATTPVRTRENPIANPAGIRSSRPTNDHKDELYPKPIGDIAGRLRNGKPRVLTGLYVSSGLTFPVIQQPTTDPVYVSDQPGVVTQYQLASEFGTTGILAHNTRAGSAFFQISVGESIFLVYGDGFVQKYRVASIQDFQALDPENPYSDFVDAAHPAEHLSSSNLFNRMYTGENQVVLQTCIEKDGNPSWGRMFITAKRAAPTQALSVSTGASQLAFAQ